MDTGRPRRSKPPTPAKKGRGAPSPAKTDVKSREVPGKSPPDGRLVEQVRFLARQSAEEFYERAQKHASREKRRKI